MKPLLVGAAALTAVGLAGSVAAGALVDRSPESAGPDGAPAGAATTGFFAPPADLLEAVLAPDGPAAAQVAPERYHEFYFTRAIYPDMRGGGRPRNGGYTRGSWSVDYPEADQHFTIVARRLANLDAYEGEHAVPLDDPELRRFPFLYALEVGRQGGMDLSEAEIRGLRDYLLAGGFLVIDDFWGTWEWANFEREISRVLPGRPIVDIPMDHTIFRIFYHIEEILQVPSINNWTRNGRTWEQDGYEPAVRGIFDDAGRLMVVINWNTDLGDAWEWADNPYYPLNFSTFAFEMGINMVMYGMTH